MSIPQSLSFLNFTSTPFGGGNDAAAWAEAEAASPAGAPAAAPERVAAAPKAAPAVAANAPETPPKPAPTSHSVKVRKGDTIWGYWKKFHDGASWQDFKTDFKKTNAGILGRGWLHVGDVAVMPAKRANASAASPGTSAEKNASRREQKPANLNATHSTITPVAPRQTEAALQPARPVAITTPQSSDWHAPLLQPANAPAITAPESAKLQPAPVILQPAKAVSADTLVKPASTALLETPPPSPPDPPAKPAPTLMLLAAGGGGSKDVKATPLSGILKYTSANTAVDVTYAHPLSVASPGETLTFKASQKLFSAGDFTFSAYTRGIGLNVNKPGASGQTEFSKVGLGAKVSTGPLNLTYATGLTTSLGGTHTTYIGGDVTIVQGVKLGGMKLNKAQAEVEMTHLTGPQVDPAKPASDPLNHSLYKSTGYLTFDMDIAPKVNVFSRTGFGFGDPLRNAKTDIRVRVPVPQLSSARTNVDFVTYLQLGPNSASNMSFLGGGGGIRVTFNPPPPPPKM